MNLLVPILWLLASGSAAGRPEPPAPAPSKMLYSYLLSESARSFDARRSAIAALKTPDDVKRRQAELRTRFIEALGGLPEKTPLNPRVTRSETRDGYRVEHVIFESRPNHHVTAMLYLPEGQGPFPAVLFPCGHYSIAKAAEDYQRACILLVKHGMAVLCFDPISQGERVQMLTPEGKPAAGFGTFEHTHADIGALLVGWCTASFVVWDGIRSIDYLVSRPDIDAKRLGCMGNSGGGTQTAYLMALDDRIATAVPNCYITSLERLFATIGPQDGEQNIPGQVAFGMEHADYLLMRAPRPTQINCTTRDFFDIQGAWTTFREAKLIYGILGRGERVDLFEYNEPHSLSRPLREAGAGWLRRWLARVDEPALESDYRVATEAETRCTVSGQVVPELRGKTVFDFIAEREQALSAQRGKRSRADLLATVRRLIGLKEVVPAAKAAPSRPAGGSALAKVSYETEPGIKVPGLTAFLDARDRPLVVRVSGEGKGRSVASQGAVSGLTAAGRSVLELDLRGMGDTRPAPEETPGWEQAFGYDWKEAFIAMSLNRPLLGQRVHDLLSVVAAVERPKGVSAVGVGAAAPIVLHAAALDPRIAEVTLDGGVVSWSLVARTAVTRNQLANVVPRALESYDLPDLAALIAPRPLTIKNPVDPAGLPVTQAVIEAAYASARDAYRAAGASAKLVLAASPAGRGENPKPR
jgi:cephalosporin-C deacetylase-like acetyl esterase